MYILYVLTCCNIIEIAIIPSETLFVKAEIEQNFIKLSLFGFSNIIKLF